MHDYLPLELKNLEAYMPSEFITAINRAIKYSEDIVNSSDELKDSIFQKMVMPSFILTANRTNP